MTEAKIEPGPALRNGPGQNFNKKGVDTMKKEEMRKQLERYIAETECKLELWRGVQRVTKKDGSNFKVLSKNFSGAEIVSKGYMLHYSPVIKVSKFYKDPLWAVVEDELDIYELVKYSDLEPAADRIIRESFLEPYFFLTIDEIFEKIAAHILKLEKYLDGYRADLAAFDSVFDSFSAAIRAALADVKKADSGDNTLYYMMREYMHTIY